MGRAIGVDGHFSATLGCDPNNGFTTAGSAGVSGTESFLTTTCIEPERGSLGLISDGFILRALPFLICAYGVPPIATLTGSLCEVLNNNRPILPSRQAIG